jgi:hypothetical protein
VREVPARSWAADEGPEGGYRSCIDPMQQEAAALQRRVESHWQHDMESFRSYSSYVIFAKHSIKLSIDRFTLWVIRRIA